MMTEKVLIFLMMMAIGCKGSTEPNSAQGEWTLVRAAQSGYFLGLHFADQMNGWVVGDSGKILNTNDGGNSWNPQGSGTTVTLKCVYFVNSSKGWIGGGNNSIGRTTNGGVSWSWQHPTGAPGRTFMGVSFVNESIGWIVDNFAGILHTEDGGMTWTPQTSGTTWAITSVQFLDAKEGWATATNRVVLHTTDGGNSWAVIALDSLDYGNKVVVVYDDVFFVNRSKGWIAMTSAVSGTDYHPTPMVSTPNGGTTWNCQQTPENMYVHAVVFATDRMGWGASWGGILYTNDGGAYWTYQLALPSALFVDICLVGQSHCWALTFTGNIYRYKAL
jgi:photosystem II stability/assembly factor-like uncharacterized protein